MAKLKWLAFSILVLGAVASIILLGLYAQTPRENVLLSIVLAIFSILASWILSHYYSETGHKQVIEEVRNSHQENLRTYARKAAEKVENLSGELSRLSGLLQQELENDEYDNSETALISKQERLLSAIHIINTLKSANDTYLSDWRGVIGDELEQRQEEEEETQELLREVIDRIEGFVSKEGLASVPHSGATDEISREIEKIHRDIRNISSAVGAVPVVRPRALGRRRVEVEQPCPSCGELLHYKQRERKNTTKVVTCTSCEAKAISRYAPDEGFHLEPVRLIEENVACPHCQGLCEVMLQNTTGSTDTIKCIHCGGEVRVSRAATEVRTKPLEGVPKLDEDLISSVEKKLPEQPWPRHIHKKIASELNVSNNIAQAAIQELIRRGKFKLQIEGKLYVPEE